MDTITDQSRPTTRVRPTPDAWTDAMNAVFVAHDQHNWLPYHVLETVGDELGVAARSVATRYGIHLAMVEAASGWSLGERDIAAIADAADFVEAYTGLVIDGRDVPHFPLFDRAIWRSSLSGLTRLRTGESRRRQAISEWGPCFYCWPDFRLAVAGLNGSSWVNASADGVVTR